MADEKIVNTEQVYNENITKVFTRCLTEIDLSMLTSNHKSLSIDGTACCFKTTILDELGQYYHVTKTQHRETIMNPNTFGPSFIGYASAGSVYHQSTNSFIFNDRSILNNFDWSSIIWPFLNQTKNVQVDSDEFKESLSSFDERINTYKNLASIESFFSKFNTIALIDSDENAVRERMVRRGTKSDLDRAGWKHYIAVQNHFYKKRYLFIDLNWFKDLPKTYVIAGLVKYFKHVAEVIKSRPEDKDVIEIFRKLKNINVCYPKLEKPLCISNLETHVYRIKAKSKARKILDQTVDEQAHFRSFIPNFIE